VDRDRLKALLEDVRAGRLSPEEALARLRDLPYEDLRFAKVDLHRSLRAGAPDAVFCPWKTLEQVVAIVSRLAAHHDNVLATRASAEVAGAIAAAGLPHDYHRPRVSLIFWKVEPKTVTAG
jgi:NCAIR mutase (PurE)-related protein